MTIYYIEGGAESDYLPTDYLPTDVRPSARSFINPQFQCLQFMCDSDEEDAFDDIGEQAVSILAAGNISAAITHSGKLYTWGDCFGRLVLAVFACVAINVCLVVLFKMIMTIYLYYYGRAVAGPETCVARS